MLSNRQRLLKLSVGSVDCRKMAIFAVANLLLTMLIRDRPKGLEDSMIELIGRLLIALPNLMLCYIQRAVGI